MAYRTVTASISFLSIGIMFIFSLNKNMLLEVCYIFMELLLLLNVLLTHSQAARFSGTFVCFKIKDAYVRKRFGQWSGNFTEEADSFSPINN